MRLVPRWWLWPMRVWIDPQREIDEEGCGAVICAARLVPE